MAAAFKDEFSRALAAALAGELKRAWPVFPRERFVHGIAAVAAVTHFGHYLKLAPTLGEVAIVAARTPTFLGARHRRAAWPNAAASGTP